MPRDDLVRQLRDSSDVRQQNRAALELLSWASCPLSEEQTLLSQSIREDCYRVLSSHHKDDSRRLFSPREAKSFAEPGCLPALSLDEVLGLGGLQHLSIDPREWRLHNSQLPLSRKHESAPSIRTASYYKSDVNEPSEQQRQKGQSLWAPETPNLQKGRIGLGRLNSDSMDHDSSLQQPKKAARHDSGGEHLSARAPVDPSDGTFQTALKKLKRSEGAGTSSQPACDERDKSSSKRPGRGLRSAFVVPMRADSDRNQGGALARNKQDSRSEAMSEATLRCLEDLMDEDGELPERLKNVEPKLIEQIYNEILTKETRIGWDDIAGLEHAKQCITETIIWPLKRPDLFNGTRAPSRGLLLFGPPGTGKTMIGRAIAGEIEATFFSISASSLTSKWIGEGEKLVRALFGVASCKQPAVIFIDEIDSLLSHRKSEGEHESSRRLKTQFLIEMEGCQGSDEQLLVIGATNRPHELDEAARRRLAKRLYIPLPDAAARRQIVEHLLAKDHLLEMSPEDLNRIASDADGYSGSDMAHLVREAAMIPMREALKPGALLSLKKEDVRPIGVKDFIDSLSKVRPSVSAAELVDYIEWNKKFGSADVS